MNEMGNRIRMKRIEKEMTMEQLASALGVKASAINKYEKGIVENIKRSTIQQMAVIFECDAAWLMGFDKDPVEVPQYNPRIMEFIEVLSQLTDDQVDSLLHMARLFAVQNNDK